MTLITSISGIRGTIGGRPGDALTPIDIVKFAAAFGSWVKQTTGNPKIVIGRDGRISGPMVSQLVCGTLIGMGISVIDLGLSTTPTVEMAVPGEQAGGGLILTASHNPKNWNALKLLNEKGEFVSSENAEVILQLADKQDFVFAEVNELGTYSTNNTWLQKHIDAILALPLVDESAIRERKFKVVIDCVNSTGGLALPKLLKALGVRQVVEMNCTPDGNFAHNPEPLPENLTSLAQEVKSSKAHLGIAVDPDVDRLALVTDDGEMFGEEYTLVAVADYILKNTKSDTVSNLSSSRALRDITEKRGGKHHASPVGEVHVVKKMKAVNAKIGGEGNGGIIYPELHYGRDALVGIALFLTHLAKSEKSSSTLRAQYPSYFMEKKKIELPDGTDMEALFEKIAGKYKKQKPDRQDGLKIEFETDWVHLRKSNTEPIVRIYSESLHEVTARNIANQIISDIHFFLNNKEF